MTQEFTETGIYEVDALYIKPNTAAIYIIASNDKFALVDTGTYRSTSQIQTLLDKLDKNWDQVEYIILTHIHLDHAGGASALMEKCANATLVCHPKAVRHMVNPERLISSAISVYGESRFYKMYGDIKPISVERIIAPEHNSCIKLGDRSLRFIDTPGHANHHHCIIDEKTNRVFTGDTLGVCYPELAGAMPFVFPTTTPTQFNPDALHQSINQIMSFQPSFAYLTHFGKIRPNAYLIASLHEQIDDFIMLTQQVFEQDEKQTKEQTKEQKEATLTEKITDYLLRRCLNNGCELEPKKIRDILEMDAKLNAQGLLHWAKRQSG